MSKPQVNGVTSPTGFSDTLDHIVSYPLVSDAISYYKSFSLGSRSIEVSHNIYNQFGKPVVASPLVQNSYSYVQPYAKKIDEFGNNTLSQVDANFPAIKDTDFATLHGYASQAASYPFKVAEDSRDYVMKTYKQEHKQVGGEGIVATGRAVVHTEMHIAADIMRVVADWIGPKKDAAHAELEKLKSLSEEKMTKAKKTAHQKSNEVAH